MFKKNYTVYVTINGSEEGYGLKEVLETLDYHGVIEHDFYGEPVSFHEFLEGIEKYRIVTKASKKQIKKLMNVLKWTKEIRVA